MALFCLAVAVVSWLLDDALKNSGYDLQGKERFNISSIVTAEVQNMMGLGPGLRLDYRLTLSLVGERNLVAGNASGEEFFLASLAGAGRGGENLKILPPRGGLARILRNVCPAGADVFFTRDRAGILGTKVRLARM